jgi:excisionase family DNA binding protein
MGEKREDRTQVARWLQVSEKPVYRWATHDPSMPALRIGGVIRFPRERLERWVRSREQATDGARRSRQSESPATPEPLGSAMGVARRSRLEQEVRPGHEVTHLRGAVARLDGLTSVPTAALRAHDAILEAQLQGSARNAGTGGVAERLKAPVLKTGMGASPRGFESLPLRHAPLAR